LPLPNTPPLSVRTEVGKAFYFAGLKSTFTTDAKYLSAQNRVERNERSTPASWLFGAKWDAEKAFGTTICKLSVGVQNIANRKWYNHLSRYRMLNLPEPGRNFFVQLYISF
jgi:iron complex outermembrane receptor protein